MYIKRYEAPTLIQAVELVRSELGPDAVILSTRAIGRKGVIPWARKPLFEVIAAKDPGDDIDPIPAPPKPSVPALDVTVDDGHEERLGRMNITPAPIPQFDFGEALEPVMHELQLLRAQLEQIALRPDILRAHLHDEDQGTSHFSPQVIETDVYRVPELPEGLARFEHTLSELALGRESINKVTQLVMEDGMGTDLKDSYRAYLRGRDALKLLLQTSSGWGEATYAGQRRMAFIGPTGVGKTTTIAKLAARYALMHNKSVALVTADTYRIAAVSQLRMYGELLGVEVDVAHTPEEMSAIVEERMNKDIILIDTAGRSPKNQAGMEVLSALMKSANPTETHLVMSISTKMNDLVEILERFRSLNYDRLLFTKLDESANLGEMAELIINTSLSVSFLSTGQSVPNDIEEANAGMVASMLLPDLPLAVG